MITITVKGLAKFMTARPAQQRKIVHDFKYPKEDESAAQQKFYREARAVIRAYHKKGHPSSWLLSRAGLLRGLANGSTKQRRTRLVCNERAIRYYHEHFRDKRYQLLEPPSMDLPIATVRIRVTPDLHVREKGTSKIIKLEFAKPIPDPMLIKIICQVMYEAANRNGHAYGSACVLLFDVPRGHIHRGARAGARTRADVDAACRTITAIWNTI